MFLGGELDFLGGEVFVVAAESPGVTLGEVFEGSDVGLFDGGEAFFGDGWVLQCGEDFVEEGTCGGTVAGEGEVDAVEPGTESVAESGHGGGVGFFIEGFVDYVGDEAFEEAVLEGGLAFGLKYIEGEGDFGALKLGVLGVVEFHAGFVDEFGWVFRELLESLGKVGVGFREMEGWDFAGVLELIPFFAGQLFIGVLGAVVFFGFVSFHAFGSQDDEHVIGAKVGDEFFVEFGVWLLPEVADPFSDFNGVEAEVVGEADGSGGAFAFVGIEFFEAAHDGLFLKEFFRVAGVFEHLDVGKGVGNDVVVVFESIGGEFDPDEEGAVRFGRVVTVGSKPCSQIEFLEVGEEAAFAFVAHDEGEELGGFTFVVLVASGGWEFEGEGADVFDGFDFGDAESFCGKEVSVRQLDFGFIAVFDGGEVLAGPGFELVQACLSAESQGHLVGAVVAVIKIHELFALNAFEGFEVAGGEVVGGVLGVVEGAADLELSPGVVLEVFLVLGVDGVHFPVGEFFSEEGGDEELGEAVNGAFEGVVVDLEVIVGVVG